MGFSSVPRLPGWSFQQLICGGVLPPPHCPDKSGPAVSPTDKLRKDSALTPVTSEKSTLFIGVTRIVRFSKALVFSLSYPVFQHSLAQAWHAITEVYRLYSRGITAAS